MYKHATSCPVHRILLSRCAGYLIIGHSGAIS